MNSVSKPLWIDARNSGDFLNTLELCDTIITEEEMYMISISEEDRNKIKRNDHILKYMLNDIQERALKIMKDLDGKDSTRARATMALGKRYKAYKKLLIV